MKSCPIGAIVLNSELDRIKNILRLYAAFSKDVIEVASKSKRWRKIKIEWRPQLHECESLIKQFEKVEQTQRRHGYRPRRTLT